MNKIYNTVKNKYIKTSAFLGVCFFPFLLTVKIDAILIKHG